MTRRGNFTESISIEVEARNEEGEAVTANVTITQSQACPEFEKSIQMNIPENINTPLPVLYMETNCQGSEDTAPSLTGIKMRKLYQGNGCSVLGFGFLIIQNFV